MSAVASTHREANANGGCQKKRPRRIRFNSLASTNAHRRPAKIDTKSGGKYSPKICVSDGTPVNMLMSLTRMTTELNQEKKTVLDRNGHKLRPQFFVIAFAELSSVDGGLAWSSMAVQEAELS